jgi:chemotaxis protein histidine kinase CheA
VQATKQQQIIGYFIEEAKEHLDTIEQGVLNLQATMADADRLNELFRAAHSVKGGAAMLGFSAIQQVSHHLEDCFKLLTEHQVTVDRRLEDMFLKGADRLKELVEELQSPYGMQKQSQEQAEQVEPLLKELERYLNSLIRGQTAPAPSRQLNADLPVLMNTALKKMLQLFRQGDSPATRQQLGQLCTRMEQIHSCQEWQALMRLTQAAIASSQYPYQTMASVIVKELKQAGDLLVMGKTSEIIPSKNLQQLAKATKPAVPNPVELKPAVTPPVISQPSATPAATTSSVRQQVTIPVEPRAAARVLLEVFNKQQLIEMADFIMKAIQ